MFSGKSELSKQTFSARLQTSASFSLLIQHLLEAKGLDYIMTGSIQSAPFEKRFGIYRQLSGGNYFDCDIMYCVASFIARGAKKLLFVLLVVISLESRDFICTLLPFNI